jgi:hypothetical protein
VPTMPRIESVFSDSYSMLPTEFRQ